MLYQRIDPVSQFGRAGWTEMVLVARIGIGIVMISNLEREK